MNTESKVKEIIKAYLSWAFGIEFKTIHSVEKWLEESPMAKSLIDELARVRWVKASDRLPVKPDSWPYSYSENNDGEPPVVFVNHEHSASFLHYHSLGYGFDAVFEQYKSEGWTIDYWYWLDESEYQITEDELDKIAEKYVEPSANGFEWVGAKNWFKKGYLLGTKRVFSDQIKVKI